MNKLTGPLLDTAQTTAEARPIAPSLERRRLRAYAIMLLLDAKLTKAGDRALFELPAIASNENNGESSVSRHFPS